MTFKIKRFFLNKIEFFLFIVFLWVKILWSQNIILEAKGELDTSFGTEGKVVLDLSNDTDIAYEMVVQGDGKIVLGGEANGSFALVRLLPNGSLDPSFGNNGIVITKFFRSEVIKSLAIQKDGKIFAAGNTYFDKTGQDFILIRYNTDGSIDKTFGQNGFVKIDLGEEISDTFTKMIVQKDEKIVLLGEFKSSFALVRLNPNGSIDTSFGNNGIIKSLGLSLKPYDISIQEDGKIILIGYTITDNDWDFIILRFNQNGTIDQSFGKNGIVILDIGTYTGESRSRDIAKSLLIQSDGKIVVGGETGAITFFDTVLVRLNSNGSLDPYFGNGGIVINKNFNDLYKIVLQQNGKVLVAGIKNYNLIITRYNLDGSIDPNFGDMGIVKINFNHNPTPYSIKVQKDGKVIVSGTVYGGPTKNDFLIVRCK